MDITILVLRTRGEVQPAVALGVGLRRADHTVRLGSYAQYADLATAHGLAFAPIRGDVQAMLRSEEGRAALASRNPLRFIWLIRQFVRDTAVQTWADIKAACVGTEALLSMTLLYYPTDVVATTQGLPHINAQLQPLLPTGAFPDPMLPAPPLRTPAINRATHHLSEMLFYQALRGMFNLVRREAGLGPLPWQPTLSRAIQGGMPTLYGYSPLLVPTPAGWPPSAAVTGFWLLDPPADYTPPVALARFLAAGDPPVYIGFGSMNTRDPRRTGELALRALGLTGRRGVLMRGWGGLDAQDVPPSVLLLDEVPHTWLFPQLAAVVHHGGPGTAAAGLRAGLPSVLIPFFLDQPFWSERLVRLGVAPAPLARHRLTAERLARAIEAATAPPMQARAAAVGRSIAAEDGVLLAVQHIERVLGV